jgi:hypothetical protein
MGIMDQKDLLQGCKPGLDIHQRPTEVVRFQHIINDLKTIWVFRVKDPGLVFEIKRMFDDSGFCHGPETVYSLP